MLLNERKRNLGEIQIPIQPGQHDIHLKVHYCIPCMSPPGRNARRRYTAQYLAIPGSCSRFVEHWKCDGTNDFGRPIQSREST